MDIEAELAALKARVDALEQKGKKRGTRLPEKWHPSEEEYSYARKLGLSDMDITKAVGKFRAYWLSAPQSKALKVRWDLTWKESCRREAEYLGKEPLAEINRTEDESVGPDTKAALEALERVGVDDPEYVRRVLRKAWPNNRDGQILFACSCRHLDREGALARSASRLLIATRAHKELNWPETEEPDLIGRMEG